ncbi:MAG: DUF3429 domain-containing protein [Burkholderiaceae bacterium]
MSSPTADLADSGNERLLRRLAWWLGLGGLVPFVGHAVAAWWMPAPLNQLAVSSQVLYAALILSFLGALHWGMALNGTGRLGGPSLVGRLVWSVLPACYGLFVAQLVYRHALVALAAGLLAAYLVDWMIYRQSPGLAWFLNLCCC